MSAALIDRAARAYFGEHYRGEVRHVDAVLGGFWEALTEGQSHDDVLGYQRFDPLDFSDDALALQARLMIGISFDTEAPVVVAHYLVLGRFSPNAVYVEYDGSLLARMAAMRRAITLAAVEYWEAHNG